MKLTRQDAQGNVYYFVCEGCQSVGELSVDPEQRLSFGCPEGCGATYVQWNNPLTGDPDLMCVVCPVFEPLDALADEEPDYGFGGGLMGDFGNDDD